MAQSSTISMLMSLVENWGVVIQVLGLMGYLSPIAAIYFRSAMDALAITWYMTTSVLGPITVVFAIIIIREMIKLIQNALLSNCTEDDERDTSKMRGLLGTLRDAEDMLRPMVFWMPVIHGLFGLWPFLRMKTAYFIPLMSIIIKPPLINVVFILAPYVEVPLLIGWLARIFKQFFQRNNKYNSAVIPGATVGDESEEGGQGSSHGRGWRLFGSAAGRLRRNQISPVVVNVGTSNNQRTANNGSASARVNCDANVGKSVAADFSIDVRSSYQQLNQSSMAVDSEACDGKDDL